MLSDFSCFLAISLPKLDSIISAVLKTKAVFDLLIALPKERERKSRKLLYIILKCRQLISWDTLWLIFVFGRMNGNSDCSIPSVLSGLVPPGSFGFGGPAGGS